MARAGQFKPGQSGNPGGCSRAVKLFRARARKVVDDEVFDLWVEEVRTHGDYWFECSKLLAAYGMGKPPDIVDEEDDSEAFEQRRYTVEELRTLNEAEARARAVLDEPH